MLNVKGLRISSSYDKALLRSAT